MLKGIDEALFLPKTELGILQTLRGETSPNRPTFVAGELDCSYQLVSRRAMNLEDRGLLIRTSNEKDQRVLEITDLAEKSYFSESESRELDLPHEDQESGN
jgi:DNA-binding MarR family transcriptional regulator